MSFESIPKDDSDWQSLQESWERAANALSYDEKEVLKVTNNWNPEEGIKLIEKYLKDNFESLSQKQRDFLLISLRVKNYKLQNKLS